MDFGRRAMDHLGMSGPGAPRSETRLDWVSRREWGAESPNGPMRPFDHRWPLVLWTFSNSEPCHDRGQCERAMRDLQRRDKGRGMPDIQYNFYIGGDLNVYEGRGWTRMNTTIHPEILDYNEMNLGLAYIGKYEGQNYPNQGVLDKRKAIVIYGMEKGYIIMEYSNIHLMTNLNQ